MHDTGLTEDSEYLTVIPTQHIIIRQKRHKYGCGKCHGVLRTAPLPKRIMPGSTLSDEMMIEVAMSKYCDLIPVERYADMAARQGLPGLPPQSLTEATHNLADFVKPAYKKVKEAREKFPEAQYFIDRYREIYHLEEMAREKPPDETLRIRSEMIPIFETIKSRALEDFKSYPVKSSIGKAYSYFLKN